VLATFIVDINAMVFGSPSSCFARAIVFMVGAAAIDVVADRLPAPLGALFSG
jgi:hypothetical protein